MSVQVLGPAMLRLSPLDVPPPNDQFAFGTILVILLVVVAALIALVFISRLMRRRNRK